MDHSDPPNLPHPAKAVLKIDLLCLWGALTNFPCKLRLKFFSSPWGVQVNPLHPLATPMTRLEII